MEATIEPARWIVREAVFMFERDRAPGTSSGARYPVLPDIGQSNGLRLPRSLRFQSQGRESQRRQRSGGSLQLWHQQQSWDELVTAESRIHRRSVTTIGAMFPVESQDIFGQSAPE